MCGFFGWLSLQDDLSQHQRSLCVRSLTTLIHRGPDSEGQWNGDRIYLGHRRLSIIDLSDDAAQPMMDDTGRYVLVFNGEIYNYIELRAELESLGEKFHSNSDTEVLLIAFRRWGKAALTRLNGMFSGAFFDKVKHQLFLFRDNLGQKPLYFCGQSDRFLFASELRALLDIDDRNWFIDRHSFRSYLANGYYHLDTTPIVGIKKLLPGCWIEVDQAGIREGVWWRSTPGDGLCDMSLDEGVYKFDHLFKSSCELALRSDVPVGIFLSGGIDSTLVLDTCLSLKPNINAFTISMGESDYDESKKALNIVKNSASVNHLIFKLNDEAVKDEVVNFLCDMDEPHGDPGFVNALFLSRMVKEYVAVALSGDGADELFYGYLPFKGLSIEPFVQALPGIKLLKSFINQLHPGDGYAGLLFKARAYLQAFPSASNLKIPFWLATLSAEELTMLLPNSKNEFNRFNEKESQFKDIAYLLSNMNNHTSAQKMAYYYQQVFLPEFICHHTDRAAMQHSLEVRSPFLSPELITFANSLPDSLKNNRFELKHILRESLRRRGYSKLISNQAKQGFTFPIARWLKTSLRPLVDDLGDASDWTGGEVDKEYVSLLCQDHLSGRANNFRIIYNLIVFYAWRKRYPKLEFSNL